MKVEMVPFNNERNLTPNQFRMNQLIWSLDVDAKFIEGKWGVDRLHTLVPDDMAAKWHKQIEKVNDAIKKEKASLLDELVDGCRRGYDAMEKVAMEAGHRPIEPDAMAVRLPDGNELVIVKTVNEARAYAAKLPADSGKVVWTLQEVANVVGRYGLEEVNVVKQLMPGAVVRQVSKDPFDFKQKEIDLPPEF